jgi:uncharacterized protein (TIGR03086 family)
MTHDQFTQFDRAAAQAEGVIAAIDPGRHADPTPCTEWSVGQLINHLVTGNLMFVATITGSPRPDRSRDHLGADPREAFRSTTAQLRSAFSAEGVLEGLYPSPLGERPGAALVDMRAIEMTLHTWDLAKATGQSTDLDADLAESALRALRGVLTGDRTGGPFGPEQPAPPRASAADRLAAFAGRVVGG